MQECNTSVTEKVMKKTKASPLQEKVYCYILKAKTDQRVQKRSFEISMDWPLPGRKSVTHFKLQSMEQYATILLTKP